MRLNAAHGVARVPYLYSILTTLWQHISSGFKSSSMNLYLRRSAGNTLYFFGQQEACNERHTTKILHKFKIEVSTEKTCFGYKNKPVLHLHLRNQLVKCVPAILQRRMPLYRYCQKVGDGTIALSGTDSGQRNIVTFDFGLVLPIQPSSLHLGKQPYCVDIPPSLKVMAQ